MAYSLDNIKRPAAIKPPRILIYGKEKVGKTTFGASAPDVVFVYTEQGASADVNPPAFEHEPGREVARSKDEVFSALQFLATEPHEFHTLVIDSITFLEKIFWEALCKQYNRKSITDNEKGSPFAWNRGHDLAMELWRQFTGLLDQCRNDRGMAIVLIAHCKQRVVSPPDREDYLQYCPDVHTSSEKLPSQSTMDYLARWADAVLFIDDKLVTVKSADGDRHFGKSTGERLLHTVGCPAFVAGNRFELPQVLPFQRDTSWAEFEKHFREYISRSNSRLKGANGPAERDSSSEPVSTITDNVIA